LIYLFLVFVYSVNAVKGPDYIDIYMLALDGSGNMERITYFADYPGYLATNPAVSNDRRYIAFQIAKKEILLALEEVSFSLISPCLIIMGEKNKVNLCVRCFVDSVQQDRSICPLV